MDELKPCPFCGGEARICTVDFAGKVYDVVCNDKGCNYAGYDSPDEAIAAWSRRAQPENSRQHALQTGVCPMCEDCPDGCPVETPKDSRNIVTNADRIRGMSDEELARFLGDEPPYFATYKQYIDWLRKPIESEVEHDG